MITKKKGPTHHKSSYLLFFFFKKKTDSSDLIHHSYISIHSTYIQNIHQSIIKPIENIQKKMSKKNSYKPFLILYNTVAGSLWFIHLYNTLNAIINNTNVNTFYSDSVNFLTITQCLAIIEIFNSLFKIVKSPLLTTFAQVSSRLLIVIGSFKLSATPISSFIGYEYFTLSLAWSITEVVRYFFYAFNLLNIQPKVLVFLRYNMFPVLYPLGVTSELIILYKTTQINDNSLVKLVYIVSMLAYLPGFPVLFSHMWIQRKKAMKQLFKSKKQA